MEGGRGGEREKEGEGGRDIDCTFHSTPEGRATASKEEGNELFRRKCYQQAVHEYTAGLKEEGVGVALRAILYTNRAAANSHMGR